MLEHVNKIQSNFYNKKLFWLPRSCTMVAVRVELRLRPLAVRLLGRALNRIEKILEMDRRRLPRLCLETLVKKNFKRNWYFKIIKLIRSNGIETYGNVRDIINRKEQILLEYENKIIESDWKKFIEIKNFVIGKEMNYLNFKCNYFESDLNINVKRVIAQIRLAVKYHGSIHAGKNKIALKEDECCKLCNVPRACTLKHILTECGRVKGFAEKLLKYNNLEDINKWYEILNSEDNVNLRKVVIIFYKIREMLEEESQ